MPSSYSPRLRIELQADGENDSTWGDKMNVNLGTIIEAAIAGIVTVPLNDADYTLSVQFGNADEARNAMLVISGVLSIQRNIIVPAVSKWYIVRNITAGGFGIQIKTPSGSGVVIANGDAAIVFCDGSNVVAAGSGSSNGGVTPQKLSTAAAIWAVNGSFGVNRSEAMTPNFGRIAVDGTVGSEFNLYFKGTKVASWGAEVDGNGTATGVVMNASGLPFALQQNGVDAMQMETDGTVDFAKTVTAAALVSTGTIVANGNISAFSDARYKENWQPLRVGFIDRLTKVQYGTYNFKDTKKRFAGVSAQDLKKLLPEAIECDEDGKLSVAYGNAALVAVIQLARDFIKLRDFGVQMVHTAHAMQERIAALEAKVK
jgi:hypothetical protein